MVGTDQVIARDLGFLLGTFAGTDRMYATEWAPAGDRPATAEGWAELGGAVLVLRQTQEAFAALGVLSLDPATGEVLLHAHDSAGFPPDPPARGGLRDGELVLDRTTPRGSSRTTYAPTEDGFRWSKAFHAPGETAWRTVVEGIMRRA